MINFIPAKITQSLIQVLNNYIETRNKEIEEIDQQPPQSLLGSVWQLTQQYIKGEKLMLPEIGKEDEPAQGRQKDVNLLIKEIRNTNRLLDDYLKAIDAVIKNIKTSTRMQTAMQAALEQLVKLKEDYFSELNGKLEKAIAYRNIDATQFSLIQKRSSILAYNYLKSLNKAKELLDIAIVTNEDTSQNTVVAENQLPVDLYSYLSIIATPELQYFALQYTVEYLNSNIIDNASSADVLTVQVAFLEKITCFPVDHLNLMQELGKIEARVKLIQQFKKQDELDKKTLEEEAKQALDKQQEEIKRLQIEAQKAKIIEQKLKEKEEELRDKENETARLIQEKHQVEKQAQEKELGKQRLIKQKEAELSRITNERDRLAKTKVQLENRVNNLTGEITLGGVIKSGKKNKQQQPLQPNPNHVETKPKNKTGKKLTT
jgi:hypothetical protein